MSESAPVPKPTFEIGDSVVSIPLSQIHADEDFNCRGPIAAVDVMQLANDIEINGLVTPILVNLYPVEMREKTGFSYRLIAGFRRYAAHVVKSMKEIKCNIVLKPLSETEARLLNLTENIQREQLNIMQEARALAKLQALGLNEFEAARRLNTSRGWVQIRYMLLKLPPQVQSEIAAGMITQSQIRDLYSIMRLSGPEICVESAKQLKEMKLKGRTNVTINPNKTNPTAKRHRSSGEIGVMLRHVQSIVPSGFATRCLAWAAGNICDAEIFDDIAVEAEKINIPYNKPKSTLEIE
jgi:ParB family chromosome partitioning protein